MITEKIKIYQKRYREAHKEEIKAYAKWYDEIHKEEKRERDRIYREIHKEEKKIYLKKYHEEHHEEELIKSQKYEETHRGQRDEYKKEYRKMNRKLINAKKHSLSLEEFNDLFESQDGCCAICGRHQTELKHALCIDHNHVTGEVRGLLCDSCNKLLGFSSDDIEILLNAIKYLEK